MDQLIVLLLAWGWLGLVIATFTESFISPLMPDLILVPLCLADPANAINLSLLATVTSVAGGIIGYGIGFHLGPSVLSRFAAVRSMLTKIEDYSPWQIAWTVFLAVLSPLPYKVIAIAAGALKINIPIFLITSLAGRGKRFIVEGVLIYFCGPSAIQLFRDYTQASTIVLVAVVLVGGGIWWWRRTHKPLPTDPCLEITDTAEEG